MKNFADLGGCYLPWPLASVDNTVLAQNSSYPARLHSILFIAKYIFTTSTCPIIPAYFVCPQKFCKTVVHFVLGCTIVLREIETIAYANVLGSNRLCHRTW